MDKSVKPADEVEAVETQQPVENGSFEGFMFIGELAKETGIDPKTIRFYERAGLLSPPRHGRFRTYMESDVRRLKYVLTMRRLGISIAHIRKALESDKEALHNEATASLLSSHLDTLRSREAEVAKQLEATADVLHRVTKTEKA
jgi:MerR family transcriptional regulator, copper efflux regulator